MASSSTSSDGTETVKINLRLTETLLDRVDEEWQGRGFNSRSEFLRNIIHDAVENPTFDRDELLALAIGERDIREGRTYSREEILEEFDVDVGE